MAGKDTDVSLREYFEARLAALEKSIDLARVAMEGKYEAMVGRVAALEKTVWRTTGGISVLLILIQLLLHFAKLWFWGEAGISKKAFLFGDKMYPGKRGKVDDSEITRTFDAIMRGLDENTRALIRFEELVKHLTTKEDTALLRVDMQKLQVGLVKWIIGTSVTVGAALLGTMVFMLQHWKP
jgi:hypothetical protein